MRIECAVLCDAANVREDLLNIIGAGLSRVTFAELPASLPIAVAVRVVLESRELRDGYEFEMHLKRLPTEAIVGGAKLGFGVDKEGRQGFEEEAALAFVMPLSMLQVEQTGKYVLEASLSGRRLGTFPLRIELKQPPESSIEPGA